MARVSAVISETGIDTQLCHKCVAGHDVPLAGTQERSADLSRLRACFVVMVSIVLRAVVKGGSDHIHAGSKFK